MAFPYSMEKNNISPESEDQDDDLYSGYGSLKPSTTLGYPVQLAGPSSYGLGGRQDVTTSLFRNPTKTGMGTRSGIKDASRPMTSRKAAGFTRNGRPGTTRPQKMFDPLNQYKIATNKDELEPEDTMKQMEQRISALIEESSILQLHGDRLGALEKAKEAAKKERLLSKQRQQNSSESSNLDLTFVSLLNLAHQYENNKMYQEAINTFMAIAQNKNFNQAGRMRVNVGNLYFEQGKFAQAIKMYRMALDQIPSTFKETRIKTLRNIGNAFVRLAKYQDVVTAFESVMDSQADHQTAFNLIICHYALGDKDGMRRCFQRLSAVPPIIVEQYVEETKERTQELTSEEEFQVNRQDELCLLAIDRKKKVERYIILSTKLIAPVIEEAFSVGYDWAVETVRAGIFSDVASELEIAKAMQFLKVKEYEHAIETLKSYEKKDQKLIGTAATNIAFLYFSEGEYKLAEKYSELAVKYDRYNSKALCNRGNCYFIRGKGVYFDIIIENYQKAIELYQDALAADALCIESMYNLALAYKKLKQYQDAIFELEKLHAMTRNNADVIFQIADCFDLLGHQSQCVEWLNILISLVPTDPSVLLKMGQVFSRNGDQAQALHYLGESFRYYPADLNVLTWLGNYYVQSELYEQAIKYFERGASLEPYDIKWLLQIANCYKRSGNVRDALEGYRVIHDRFPENIECLKYLVKMCNDMGLSNDATEYSSKLANLDKNGTETFAEPKPIRDLKFQSASNDSMLSEDDSMKGLKRSTISMKNKEPTAQPATEDHWNEKDMDIALLLPD